MTNASAGKARSLRHNCLSCGLKTVVSIPGGITRTPPHALAIGLRPAISASHSLFATIRAPQWRYARNFRQCEVFARIRFKGVFKIGHGAQVSVKRSHPRYRKQPPVKCHISCKVMTTPIPLGSVSSQLGTLNQSATVCRCTTSTPSRSSAAGGDNNRRVPCHGSVDKETYDRRITRSKRDLSACPDSESLHSTRLSIPCSVNALERSAANSKLPPEA